MIWRSQMRLVVPAALIAAVVLAACGETTPTDEPSPSATAEPSGSGALEQPAIWPAADVSFESPTAAAEDFVTRALGVPATLGEFMAGDSRSGEIEVGFSGEAGGSRITRGLLLLRQLGPSNGWFVLSAPSDVVTITTLGQGDEVAAGAITVAGLARGFEGSVTVTAFVAGDRAAVLDQEHTQAGSMEEPQPYEVILDLADANAGETVVILVQGGTGLETDPGDFAAIAVVVGS